MKLSSQITKVASAMKKTIAAHNSWHGHCAEYTLHFEDVKDPKSVIFGMSSTAPDDNNAVPFVLKRRLIESFCLLQRVKEEECLLKDEMKRLILFHQKQHRLIESHLQNLDSSTEFNLGLAACLRAKQQIHRFEVISLPELFKGFIDVDMLENIGPSPTYGSLSDNFPCLPATYPDEGSIESEMEDEDQDVWDTSDSDMSDMA